MVRSGLDGPVKIGWASHIAGRMRVLQTGHPGPLKLIRTIDGAPETESWLHRNFAALRMNGEWFRFDAVMMTVEPPMVFRKQAKRLSQAKPESGDRQTRPSTSRGDILFLLEEASRLLTVAGSHIDAFPGSMRLRFLDMSHSIEDIFINESRLKIVSDEVREKQHEEITGNERDNLNRMLIRLINEPAI